MKKLLALSLVFVVIFGFDTIMCKRMIRTMEREIQYRDSLIIKKDEIIERYDSMLTVIFINE